MKNAEIQAEFSGLIASFYMACMQQLGKIANSMTGKVDKDLTQAKYSIDMLTMLKDKTKGNLTEQEEKMMNQTIATMQMNYVDEVNAPKETKEEKKDEVKE